MQFKKGLINHPKVQSLITEHRQEMYQNSPHESVHALNTGDFAQKMDIVGRRGAVRVCCGSVNTA